MNDRTPIYHTTNLLAGMSRAAILPFGPLLVHRLLVLAEEGQEEGSPVAWSKIALPFAMICAAYLVGHYIGHNQSFTGNNSLRKQQEQLAPHSIARLAGVTIALNIFSLGAGLDSLYYLVFLRLLTGNMSGYISGVTNRMAVDVEPSSNSKTCLPQGPQAKLFIMGYAVSSLLGGLAYRAALKSSKIRALTGQEPYTLTPMFFVFLCFMGEVGMRILFLFSGRIKKPTSSSFSRRRSFAEPINMESQLGDPLSHSRHTPGNRRRLSSKEFIRRPRLDSAMSETSLSDFYDCELFDEEESMHGTVLSDDMVGGEHQVGIAIYKDDRCIYEDGTPAFVSQGDSKAQIPDNYLKFCGGNQRKALNMFQATQEWRWQNNVWRIHTAPHPHFEKIKVAYPHFLHGHTKEGCPVIYEQPGKMNLKDLFKTGCTVEHMVQHYIFFLEFVSNVVSNRPEILNLRGEGYKHNSSSWNTCVVMDVTGISLSLLSGDVVKYLSRAGDVNTNHFPLTMKRVIIVNAPFWLAGVWSGIKGLTPESVPVEILSSSRSADGLRKYLDDDQIPMEYGGSSEYALGEHPYERALKSLVNKAGDGTPFDGPIELTTSQIVPSRSLDSLSSDDEEGAKLTRQPTGSWDSPTPQSQPLRRRALSHDIERRGSMEPILETVSPKKRNGEKHAGVLVIVSILLFLWSSIQGAIECILPLWIMTPPLLGGLGYIPSRAGTSFFCACVVMLWVMRTKVARLLCQTTPSRSPMRAFRIGVGTELVLCILLPTIPSTVVSVARADSVLNMASTVIFLAATALSWTVGQSAIKTMHEVACQAFATAPEGNHISYFYGLDRLKEDCRNGKWSHFVQFLGEFCGVLAMTPVFAWSTIKERPTPFDASCGFFVASLFLFVLYLCSFSVHLNNHGEFVTHPSDERNGSNGAGADSRSSHWAELFAVPLNDVIALLEDTRLSSPLDAYGGSSRERLSSKSGVKDCFSGSVVTTPARQTGKKV